MLITGPLFCDKCLVIAVNTTQDSITPSQNVTNTSKFNNQVLQTAKTVAITRGEDVPIQILVVMVSYYNYVTTSLIKIEMLIRQ